MKLFEIVVLFCKMKAYPYSKIKMKLNGQE